MSQIYVLHDSDPKNHPMVRISLAQAAAYNAKGYGVYQTINEFNGPRRIKNLVRINAWAIDIDDGSKDSQLARIRQGLTPTMVVETRRGYQVYWAAKDAKPEHWNEIVLKRLVPFYHADPKARDLARILRRPGFYHLKDPKNPFLVRKVWEWKVAYTELQMAMHYSPIEDIESKGRISNQPQNHLAGNMWERIANLNCEEALQRISGHPFVNGETYSFRSNSSGTKNIFVNGKSTSCWIDRNDRIGSLDGGGPTIYQWLNWFHKNPRMVVDFIKEVFPECQI
jgi:hypothetical protein